MRPIITAFATSPDRGRGLARDMRVRWALEELGQPYEVRLLSFAEMKQPDHLAENPFGQIPTYRDDRAHLFESGAILSHVAGRWPGLLPLDDAGRARAVMWVFAALNTVEPPIVERSMAWIIERDAPWFAARGRMLDERVAARLDELTAWMDGRDWLEDEFSAGDLMMISVLLRLKGTGLLEAQPDLLRYVARGEARPAYRRAFDAQLAVFRNSGAEG